MNIFFPSARTPAQCAHICFWQFQFIVTVFGQTSLIASSLKAMMMLGAKILLALPLCFARLPACLPDLQIGSVR